VREINEKYRVMRAKRHDLTESGNQANGNPGGNKETVIRQHNKNE